MTDEKYTIKDDFIGYLKSFQKASLEKNCKKLISKCLKAAQKSDWFSMEQFIEIIGNYHDMNNSVEDNQNINTRPETMNYDNEYDAFSDFLSKRFGIDNIEVIEMDDEFSKPSKTNNKVIGDSVEWIKRPYMIMWITKKSVVVNDSLMDYLRAINEYNYGPRMMLPYMEDKDNSDDSDDVEILLGTLKNDNGELDIAIGMTNGISQYHKFTVIEMDNGKGEFSHEDVKMFNTSTKNKLNGYYLFKLTDDKSALIGKKITDTVISNINIETEREI